MAEISASLEDYLEAVFVLENRQRVVRITDIAAFLSVSKPSVNRAINTLKEKNMLEHENYGEIRLTPSGETIAATVLHRHKLLKRFLTDTLGVDETNAEEDACRMEHVISSETIEKLFEYLEKQV